MRVLRRIGILPAWIQDGALGTVIFAVSANELSSSSYLIRRPELAMVLLAVQTLSLTFRRYQPSAVLFAMAVASLLLSLREIAGGSSYLTILALILAIFSVASRRPPRASVPMVAVAAATIYVATVIGNPTQEHDLREALGFCFPISMLWLVGNHLRVRNLQTEAAEARADRLERERALAEERAAGEERARIARELHDVVAHSLSVIVVQAGAARRVASSHPGAPLEALASIETTGRQAMTEMRRLLGMLRKGEHVAPLAPQPGLERLDALLDKVRAAGLDVQLEEEGKPFPLPPGLDVSAFRIVQEALTNCLRHADARRAVVRIEYGPQELRLSVSDDGVGVRAGSAGSAGHGLAGMQERVEMFGGRLEANGQSGSGFSVVATLPLGSSP